jgi:polyhydroxybutyrate depolymerase
VLLDFHGYSGNAAQQLRYSRLGDVAGPRGYLVVAIDGRDQIRRWVLADTDAEPDAMGASDVAVVDAVLDLILEPLCGSTDAIHAAGMSNGAVFAAVYGCASRHGVDAVATVAFTTGRAGCRDDSQIPTLAIHGTGDPVVPYEGRDLPLIRTVLGWSLEPAEEAMQHKADLNGCDGADDERIGADVTRRTWRNCDAETVFYRVDGGGHGWPGPGQPASGFGRTTETIDATQLIVDFFDRN